MNLQDFRPENWMERAVCRNYGAELWFSEIRAEQDLARQICQTCPVLQPCLELALRYEEDEGGRPHGIWGGTRAAQRRRMVKARRRRRLAERIHGVAA